MTFPAGPNFNKFYINKILEGYHGFGGSPVSRRPNCWDFYVVHVHAHNMT